jgi:hypothetical protein
MATIDSVLCYYLLTDYTAEEIRLLDARCGRSPAGLIRCVLVSGADAALVIVVWRWDSSAGATSTWVQWRCAGGPSMTSWGSSTKRTDHRRYLHLPFANRSEQTDLSPPGAGLVERPRKGSRHCARLGSRLGTVPPPVCDRSGPSADEAVDGVGRVETATSVVR